MEHIIYSYILFASFVVMYAYGLFIFFTHSPDGREYDNYRVSRKAFGTIMIIWASYLVIHWYFNLRLNYPILASSLCMSCYYPGIMLFELTFSSLINRNYPIVKRVKKIALNAIILNAIILANYLLFQPSVQKIVLMVMAVGFVIEMIRVTRRFLITYRNALRRADNYYSENTDIFIRWMPNCVYIAIAFGFAGSILSFGTNSAVSVYMFGGLLLFTYIFISYQNYMINITKMKELLLSEDDVQELQTTDTGPNAAFTDNPTIDNNSSKDISSEEVDMSQIENRINKWVSERGFTTKGITIEELSMTLYTNRTYLSSFINSTYNLSFREWIASHRIEYAKELLKDTDLPSNKIADNVGYSPNAFTTIFTKAEKMSPMQWRNANKSKVP